MPSLCKYQLTKLLALFFRFLIWIIHAAICKRPCQNNGKCIKPEECSCPTGYTGTHCDLDIDECTSEKPCDQMCHNTDGSFYCTCRLGFILRADRQSCKKIDSTFGIDDTDIAFEAKDLENDVDSDNGLAVRMNNIEQVGASVRNTCRVSLFSRCLLDTLTYLSICLLFFFFVPCVSFTSSIRVFLFGIDFGYGFSFSLDFTHTN